MTVYFVCLDADRETGNYLACIGTLLMEIASDIL